MRHRRIHLTGLALAAALLMGCGDDKRDASSYQFGSKSFTTAELVSFLNGNLVIVASHNAQGVSDAQIAGSLVQGLVTNGIDFSQLSKYTISFSNGDYTFAQGSSGIGFSLYFTSAFGGYRAGDKIPYNIFDYHSWVTNVNVSITGSFPHYSYGYTYTAGPLNGLITGSVTFSGTSLSNLGVKLHLDADAVSFAINSHRTYASSYPWNPSDSLTINMTTTPPATLSAINALFAAGGFGFSYDDTAYDSVFFGLSETFANSAFFMKSDSAGWYWEGTYGATLIKDGVTYYLQGQASNRNANYTNYYSDAALTDKLGEADHDADLKGGVMTLKDGTQINYTLSRY
jgi:hypothetical protein